MKNKEFLIKHGFEEMTAEKIGELVRVGKVEDLGIDADVSESAMLIGRTRAKKAIIKLEDKRLIIVQNDKAKTYLFNVPVAAMENILLKVYENGRKEIVFDLMEQGVVIQITYYEV